MPIVFDEESHTYTNTDNGKNYRSVTTVLGDYKKPFDSDYHSKRIAKREGVTQQAILDRWEKIKVDACDRGTKIHKSMEEVILDQAKTFAKSGDVPEGLDNSLVTSFMDNIDSIKYVQQVKCEEMVWDHDFEVAGLGDIFVVTSKGFFVKDFKTNKRFRYYSPFGEFLLTPINHLMECEFNAYAMQLSTYALFYERMTGMKCLGLEILFLDTVDSKRIWRPIPINYLKFEAIAMFEDYKLKLST
tara:strand:+ start:9399 stop:10130 length:732 start_codon:yes stop_codon:yes gene_type:complete